MVNLRGHGARVRLSLFNFYAAPDVYTRFETRSWSEMCDPAQKFMT